MPSLKTPIWHHPELCFTMKIENSIIFFVWFKNTPLKFSLIADSREIDKLLLDGSIDQKHANHAMLLKIISYWSKLKNDIYGNIIHSLIQLFHPKEIRFCKPSKYCGLDFVLNIYIKFQSIWAKTKSFHEQFLITNNVAPSIFLLCKMKLIIKHFSMKTSAYSSKMQLFALLQ